MKALKALILLSAIAAQPAFAGCLDNLTTTNTIHSKIRGFFINTNQNGDAQQHNVILDKATCTAASSGDTTLTDLTKNHYYLRFKLGDQALYALLLSAQAQGTVVEFRVKAAATSGSPNQISYVISPAGARSQ